MTVFRYWFWHICTVAVNYHYCISTPNFSEPLVLLATSVIVPYLCFYFSWQNTELIIANCLFMARLFWTQINFVSPSSITAEEEGGVWLRRLIYHPRLLATTKCTEAPISPSRTSWPRLLDPHRVLTESSTNTPEKKEWGWRNVVFMAEREVCDVKDQDGYFYAKWLQCFTCT